MQQPGLKCQMPRVLDRAPAEEGFSKNGPRSPLRRHGDNSRAPALFTVTDDRPEQVPGLCRGTEEHVHRWLHVTTEYVNILKRQEAITPIVIYMYIYIYIDIYISIYIDLHIYIYI